MAMQSYYRKSSDGAVASYDWFDLAAGAGYSTFYAVAAVNDSTTDYWLTSKQISGDQAKYDLQVSSGNTELNFDITFNNPIITAAADAYINVAMETETSTNGYIIATIFHVDSASNETSLGTATTSTRSNSGGGAEYYKIAIKVPIIEKSFSIGDKLRLSMDLYKTAGANKVKIYFDPIGRTSFTELGTGATINSTLALYLPLKIDL